MRKLIWIPLVCVSVIVLVVAAFLIVKPFKGDDKGSTSASAATLDPRFVQEAGSNADQKVDAGFETAVAKAVADGKPIATVLLERAGHNAQRLAIWSNSFGLYKDPNDWKKLVIADGTYLSESGLELYFKLEGALTAAGTTVAEGQAPATGYNSFVQDGVYTVSEKAGVTGNRKAIMVTLKNGTVIWIMFRCGNNVFPSKPHIPTPPKPHTTTTTVRPTTTTTTVGPTTTTTTVGPTTTTTTVGPKDPSQDPGPQDNAPDGGGPNKDSGPGEYIPPDQMEQPPAQPRVNPPPPTATTTTSLPTPAPEPSAPTPEEPADSYTPPPGM